MYRRPFWIQRIVQAWKEHSIIWLSGVRRVGKTTLAGMLPGQVYLNCDLPSVCRRLADPESFYDSLEKGATVVFDEVHRLDDPSRLLKIAADVYPHLKVLATGSSTLVATRKFRDSLAGRKQMIYLPPVLWIECPDVFGIKELDCRMLHGGLPEPLLTPVKDAAFFSEWIDSFYARDIQELFDIRNRTGFLKLLHLLMRQSGCLVDYTYLARLSELSRPTVKAHMEAMCIAHAVFLLPPFHGGGRREITQRPKCYAFDTGCVTFVKGWESIREDDRGLLWEHLVLDTLRTGMGDSNIYYWRDKTGREVDFIIKGNGSQMDTIECDNFEIGSLVIFRQNYSQGKNYVVSPLVKTPYKQRFGKLSVQFCNVNHLPL
ncbi:MAG: ATP-binding protein [Candidatus Scalindua sp.]